MKTNCTVTLSNMYFLYVNVKHIHYAVYTVYRIYAWEGKLSPMIWSSYGRLHHKSWSLVLECVVIVALLGSVMWCVDVRSGCSQKKMMDPKGVQF